MKGRSIYTRYLKCPDCGLVFPISANYGQRRKKNKTYHDNNISSDAHLKKLYCPKCGDIQKNFIEIDEFQAFGCRTLADVDY